MKTRHSFCIAAGLAAVALAAATTETPFAQARQTAPAAPAAAAPARGRQGDTPAPARKAGEGQGPFKKMVIRGVTLIDGTGGPPLSPMDIVIENNRITQVRQAGWPGMAHYAQPRAARCRLRDRRPGHVRDARLRRHARARLRHWQGAGSELRLQAVARPRRHHRAGRVAVVGRGVQLREGALGQERDRRAAHLQLPDARFRAGRRAR